MAPNEMDLNMASDQPSSIEILALSLVREYLSRKVRFICQHFIYCNIVGFVFLCIRKSK